MMHIKDAYSALEKMYNHRHPPIKARAIGVIYLDRGDILSKNVNYNNLWPEIIAEITEWAELHGVTEHLTNSLYTWALRIPNLDNIRIMLYICWHDEGTQMMFDLSTNFKDIRV
jgi:hypothetical protein